MDLKIEKLFSFLSPYVPHSTLSSLVSGLRFFLSCTGTVSIYTMVVIGYDRYNVIVKGFSGIKINMAKAVVILVRGRPLMTSRLFLNFSNDKLNLPIIVTINSRLNYGTVFFQLAIWSYAIGISLPGLFGKQNLTLYF